MSDDCVRAYETIRHGKANRYAIFMIVGDKIDVDQVGKLILNKKFIDQ